MDPTFAKSLPFKPHNQTSNQLLVNEQMSIPENKELFLKAVKERKDQGWEAVLTRIVRVPSSRETEVQRLILSCTERPTMR